MMVITLMCHEGLMEMSADIAKCDRRKYKNALSI